MKGTRVLRENLHTSDLKTAIRLSGPVISRFLSQLADAADRAVSTVSRKHTDWLVAQAAEQRRKADDLTRQAAAARELADWALGQVALVDKHHPGMVDRQVIVTFQQAAEACVEAKAGGWKRDLWTPSLVKQVYPHIGSIPVDQVQTDHILAFLASLWQSQPETASKVRQRTEAILDYAKVRGWRSGENPCKWDGHLEFTLTAKRRLTQTQHHPAMPWRDVPAFLAKLRSRDETAARALEFAILSACRTGEILGMRWDEINLPDRVWTVPGSRMKQGREHRIPLCDRMLAILKERKAQERGAGPRPRVRGPRGSDDAPILRPCDRADGGPGDHTTRLPVVV